LTNVKRTSIKAFPPTGRDDADLPAMEFSDDTTVPRNDRPSQRIGHHVHRQLIKVSLRTQNRPVYKSAVGKGISQRSAAKSTTVPLGQEDIVATLSASDAPTSSRAHAQRHREP
jgi:hypothetical protein